MTSFPTLESGRLHYNCPECGECYYSDEEVPPCKVCGKKPNYVICKKRFNIEPGITTENVDEVVFKYYCKQCLWEEKMSELISPKAWFISTLVFFVILSVILFITIKMKVSFSWWIYTIIGVLLFVLLCVTIGAPFGFRKRKRILSDDSSIEDKLLKHFQILQ